MAATADQPLGPCLYERLLGEAFEKLPASLKRFHREGGCYEGEVTVRRPSGRLRGWLADRSGLPRASDSGPLRLHVAHKPGMEVWTRTFGGHELVTEQLDGGMHLIEWIGPLEFYFTVAADGIGMEFEQSLCRLWGIKLPGWLSPTVHAVVTAGADHWTVAVQVRAPVLGLLTSYEGTLSCP